jgi:uncharacterized membrane protein YphA (DoxX/SURF4 family)
MKKQNEEMSNDIKQSSKGLKITYWVITSLISLAFLMSSYLYLSQKPELMDNFSKAGFPVFFVTILGVAKLLGAIALINPWFPKLKEWAYAGFTFVLIGAVWTHLATSTPFVAPLVFFILLGGSYFFNQKVNSKV